MDFLCLITKDIILHLLTFLEEPALDFPVDLNDSFDSTLQLQAEHVRGYFQQRVKDARRLGTGLFLTAAWLGS